MKFIVTTICLIITSVSILFAQEYSRTFGVISDAEWELELYEKDPEADALVLYDMGEVSFVESDGGYIIRFVKTKRIKILKNASIDEHSSVFIPYYAKGYERSDKIVSLNAYTYNKEGEKVSRTDLDQGTVFEDQLRQNVKMKKFTFPNVQKGSILEYQFVLESPRLFSLPEWEFQAGIPTVYSQLVTKVIPLYEYVYITQGITKFDYKTVEEGKEKRKFPGAYAAGQFVDQFHRTKEFSDVVYTMAMKNQPAFKDESFITSRSDYIKKINFQLTKFHSPINGTKEFLSTWPKMVKELEDNDYFGKYIKNSITLSKKLIKEEFTTQEKQNKNARSIINYVKENFEWDGKHSDFTDKTSKQFVTQKTGNSAEINLFLCGMLRAAGIDALPVILSTRDHGKIKSEYPFSHFFNHVIIFVKSENGAFLVDATAKELPFNRIPPKCLNDIGLLVSTDELGWVTLDNKTLSTTTNNISLFVDPENLSAKVTASTISTEMLAYEYKKEIGDNKDDISEYFVSSGFTEVSNVKAINYGKADRSFILAGEGTVELEQLSDKIIIAPFLEFPLSENLLKQKERTYPIDLTYQKKEIFISQITFPAGYQVLDQPQDLEIENDLIKISLKIQNHNQITTVTGSYTFKKIVYQPEEYLLLKKNMEEIVEKFNLQLVFEKQ